MDSDVPALRGHMTAAPLKALSGMKGAAAHAGSPRSHDRGPIEGGHGRAPMAVKTRLSAVT